MRKGLTWSAGKFVAQVGHYDIDNFIRKETIMDSKSAGIGIIEVVQVIFIVLKLCHLINWSWWVVLTPLWIELVVILIFIVALLKFKKDLKD